MLNLFKNFGKGILYVLVLPFLLVGLAIYAVVALFIFIFLAIKGLVLFFTGRSLYEDLPEDKEAKKRIAIANGEYKEETVTEEPKEETKEETFDEIKTDNIENDPFYIPEYLKTDEQKAEVQATKVEPETPIFETQLEEEKVPEEPVISEPIQEEENEPETEIIVQKRSQNAAILEINEEDDSDDNGVDINFD